MSSGQTPREYYEYGVQLDYNLDFRPSQSPAWDMHTLYVDVETGILTLDKDKFEAWIEGINAKH